MEMVERRTVIEADVKPTPVAGIDRTEFLEKILFRLHRRRN
jgi:hypothetical protein